MNRHSDLARRFQNQYVDITTDSGRFIENALVLRITEEEMLVAGGDALPVTVKIDDLYEINLSGPYEPSKKELAAARTQASQITRRLRSAVRLDPVLKHYVTSKVEAVLEDHIQIYVKYTNVDDREAAVIIRELKAMADAGRLTLHRYSKFDATVWISTVPPEEDYSQYVGRQVDIKLVPPTPNLAGVWVAGVDGTDLLLGDVESPTRIKTSWIMSIKPVATSELEAAERRLAEARPPFPEFQDAGEVEVLFIPDDLVRLLTGSRLGVQEVSGKKAYARLVTFEEYEAWLNVERIKARKKGEHFPEWTPAMLSDLRRKLNPLPEELGNRLLGVPDYH